ncbi:FAD-binding protein [Telmatospirillum sp.]|uniref:FAD-dependent oxidoreductase n=1 Tax=Telmatospirillum sp. TaxID=2079197 RepID=UPI00283F9C2A|nr:FAD-binding protein [Telmatospirillum sp.]MDR3440612.1 FAD-binding protein [Telmatospirillum sp.]
MTDENNQPGLRRRDFLKGGSLVAGSMILGGIDASDANAATTLPKKWDIETDVVCVGYGGAGASSAISAHDNKADVLIIEKMAEGGGNTAVSGGGFLCPTNVEDAFTYFKSLFELSHSEMDEAVVRRFAEESVKNADWVKSLRDGQDVVIYGHAGFPYMAGAQAMNKYNVKGARGRGPQFSARNLFDLFIYAVEEKRKIPVMFNTRAKRLVQNGNGEVIGVIAETNGKTINILARKGVILTAGGYEYDPVMLQNSVKGYPIYAFGNPGNTGDGQRMAEAVGAQLWHMNGASCPLGLKVPEYDGALQIRTAASGFVIVDTLGNRFFNERGTEYHAGLLAVDFYDVHTQKHPRIPCYMIFDETTRRQGPVTVFSSVGYTGQKKNYKWSADNKSEIEKGWITQASSVEELATKIGVDQASLSATIGKWNQDIKGGKEDELFHRAITAAKKPDAAADEEARVLSSPIDNAPYYAIRLHPCLLNTQGGPRRNVEAQVVNPFGEPIPRLYGAGECGSMWGLIYQGAGNIGECMVFGRIAGKNCAALKPWKK